MWAGLTALVRGLLMNWRVREIIENTKDVICTFVAWRLMPKRLVGWAFVRVWSHATTGIYGDEDATGILAYKCLQRFDSKNRNARRKP